jgi:hypothetical protein
LRPVYVGINAVLKRLGEVGATLCEADEAVPLESGDCLAVELGERTRPVRDESEGPPPPLPEGALEARLFPQRLVPASARATVRGERARVAARHARDTHRCSKIHQRLRRLGAEDRAGSPEDTTDVRVLGKNRLAECEAADRLRGVGADAGELGQVRGPAFRGDPLAGAMKIDGAPVVAEPLPGTDHVRRRRACERGCGRPALQPVEVARNDARDLRLLQHHLRDEDCVRITSAAPGQIAPLPGEPGE